MKSQSNLLYSATILIAYVAFAALYITPKGAAISGIINDLYSVLVAVAISLVIFREMLITKSMLHLPLLILFGLLSIINLLNYFFDSFVSTYKPRLTIIIIVTSCYIIIYFFYYKFKRKK
jgi:hypothetical protein